MMTQKSLFFGCVYPSYNKCPCGGAYNTRIKSPYGMNVPICDDCEDAPHRYKLKVSHRNKFYDIRYTKDGLPLTSIENVILASRQIREDIEGGHFDHTNYHKRNGLNPETLTMDGFIVHKFLKKARLPEEDQHLLREFMAPFMSNISIYRATQKHVEDFIGTFNYKFENADKVRGLYRQVLSQITA